MGAGVVVAYLQIALEAANKGQWQKAQLNAEEGAKYAEYEQRMERVR
jgi:hypothetical protein